MKRWLPHWSASYQLSSPPFIRKCSDRGREYGHDAQLGNLESVLVGRRERFRVVWQQAAPREGISVERPKPIVFLGVSPRGREYQL